jgi:hypothetical protein
LNKPVAGLRRKVSGHTGIVSDPGTDCFHFSPGVGVLVNGIEKSVNFFRIHLFSLFLLGVALLPPAIPVSYIFTIVPLGLFTGMQALLKPLKYLRRRPACALCYPVNYRNRVRILAAGFEGRQRISPKIRVSGSIVR